MDSKDTYLERNYKMDNIRCLLIFLVVFGHLLESVAGDWASHIYRIIYSFHMPMFVFVTGWFADFKAKKIVSSLIYPYVLFQILYIVFQQKVILTPLPVQFTVPHWLLWYLFACIVYYCLIPLIRTERLGLQICAVLCSIILSLLAGKDNSIGYYLSLSRILTFLPYFVAGYYIGHSGYGTVRFSQQYGQWMKKNPWFGALIICLALAVWVGLSYFIIRNPQWNNAVLYGSNSYQAANYTVLDKFKLMVIACGWIWSIWLLIPNKKCFVLSTIGSNTLSVYILHGFLVYLLRLAPWFHYSEMKNIGLAAAIALAAILVFGNRWVAEVFRCFGTGLWLEKIFGLFVKHSDAP